ncbi:marR family protein [Sphingomonas sp. S17]|jgi:DNA-binding MarR family transcriptional regulator|uniref:MarR family transcriptional regulator n=3 Tax=Sphingomonadaceae TaxID=41297 RepID=A0A411LH60_SPHPI|nr:MULTISPECIES: MarR family transcriptional regulator [Sphingomonas]MBQ1478742.1 MarR family transcriptional regulator [Sphingomonas sp.]EGI56153.1 marR family protein [Sphingomonas sp. S17]MCM3677785.1 MarR family transcriptional regulator [Sphingomonas paucimobilis]MDG5972414.1 MarR family transcriptional regulator [Sphingomonas paucimobilis]NNG57610.1 MarR family transcriptional regulator [Sphingomonas paucimobilis]
MQTREPLLVRYGRLYMRLHRLLDRRMAAQGASLARAKMLMFMNKHAPVRAADIAECFSLAPRTVTQAIDTMERDGLVRRVPDPADRRAKRLDITDMGRQVLEQTEPLRREIVDLAFGTLTDEEAAQLDHILAKLEDAIAAEVEDLPGSWATGR